MTRAIFFDFDGVIMDSMELKLNSYSQALAPYNFPRNELDRVMRQHMGTSRRRILVAMYEDLSGKKITPEIFETALALFNELDEASRSRMTLVPGTLEFLETVYRDHFTAVVTGTPEDVIKRTTAFHDLDRYFDTVRGSPETKASIIGGLMSDRKLAPEECFFIGDGKADQEAAAECGIRFVGMDGGGSSFDPAQAWRVVTDLNQLLPLL